MRQGVLTNTRVRLLMKKGAKAYRPRRVGDRKRKSVRGCIVGQDIAVLNLVVTQIGSNTIEGLTNDSVPRRLGPKRANNIRKLFNLNKKDDVRKYVIHRSFTSKKGVARRKAPKIQRLVTPLTLQRKRARKAEKMNSVLRNKEEAAAYKKLIAQRNAEKREARRSLIWQPGQDQGDTGRAGCFRVPAAPLSFVGSTSSHSDWDPETTSSSCISLILPRLPNK
jgi:small subunit ribosomal protein S6e